MLGFSFACLLAPATLSSTAKGGYTNRESSVFKLYAKRSFSHRDVIHRWCPLHCLPGVGIPLCRSPYHAPPGHEPHIRKSPA